MVPVRPWGGPRMEKTHSFPDGPGREAMLTGRLDGALVSDGPISGAAAATGLCPALRLWVARDRAWLIGHANLFSA